MPGEADQRLERAPHSAGATGNLWRRWTIALTGAIVLWLIVDFAETWRCSDSSPDWTMCRTGHAPLHVELYVTLATVIVTATVSRLSWRSALVIPVIGAAGMAALMVWGFHVQPRSTFPN